MWIEAKNNPQKRGFKVDKNVSLVSDASRLMKKDLEVLRVNASDLGQLRAVSYLHSIRDPKVNSHASPLPWVHKLEYVITYCHHLFHFR